MATGLMAAHVDQLFEFEINDVPQYACTFRLDTPRIVFLSRRPYLQTLLDLTEINRWQR